MQIGKQFDGKVDGGQTLSWSTVNWPDQWYVVWNLVPKTASTDTGPQIEWEVAVERTVSAKLTYWITVKNLRTTQVEFEARYAILNL